MEHFGQDACVFDYGSGNPDTSDLVQALVYGQQDLFALERKLSRSGARFFGGHVLAKRYAPLFASRQMTTFVRHPRDQFISHFQHKVRHHGYQGDMSSLLESAAGPALQSGMLSAVPIEAMGFVGVTERYEESLRVFNTLYAIDMPSMNLNCNPERPQGGGYVLPEACQKPFDRLARVDLALHEQANRLLDRHLEALSAGYAFVHGAVNTLSALSLDGFAFYRESVRPVQVQLLVNGNPQATMAATHDRPALRALNVPRNGFVGFHFQLKGALKEGDHVLVRVRDTGQVLGERVFASAPSAG
ncbi:MAG: hypothetical protein AB1717_08015 [Pseudomonadota bacterium]